MAGEKQAGPSTEQTDEVHPEILAHANGPEVLNVWGRKAVLGDESKTSYWALLTRCSVHRKQASAAQQVRNVVQGAGCDPWKNK